MTQPQDSIKQRAQRLSKAQTHKVSPLKGMSAFGIIGWSISLPTLAGAFFGKWLDNNFAQGFSWTLALILGGLVLGIIYAWNWISENNQVVAELEKPLADGKSLANREPLETETLEQQE